MGLRRLTVSPSRKRGTVVLLVAVVGLVSLSGGCEKDVNTEAADSSLATLALFYSQFQAANRGRLPQNKEELQGFIDSEGAGLLKEAGFKSSDELFVSTRDSQPYVLRLGDDVIDAPDGGGIIAYEQEGADGVRFVAFRAGDVQAISEVEFRQMVSEP